VTTGRELGQLAYEMWGKNGLAVFPCKSDKRPLTPQGFKNSVTDEDEILDLFGKYGDAAVYIGGEMGGDSGLFCLDLDLYRDDAKEYKKILEAAGHLPATRVHKTKNGGEHHLMFGDMKSCKPHPGVDVKGDGSYIILPPSPGYEVISDATVDAPDGLINRLRRADTAFRGLSEEALEAAILDGSDFHNSLALLAAKRAGRGDDPAVVQKRLMELLAASVASAPSHERSDRWAELTRDRGKELSRIVVSAYRKFNPDRGERLLRDTFPEHAARASAETSEEEAADDGGEAEEAFPFKRSYAAAEVSDQEHSTFLLYPLVMEGDVVVIAAAPKVGKTLVSMTISLHMASGIPLGDSLIPMDKEGNVAKIPVIYFALEGQGAIRKRLKAWVSVINDERSQRDETQLTADDLQLYVIESTVNLTDEKIKQDIADKMVSVNSYFASRGWGETGMIIFDTLTKAMPGQDQNSVDATSAVFEITSVLRENNVNAAVVFVHHTTKGGSQPRGSSNIAAEPDSILSIDRMADAVLGDRQVKTLKLSVYMARAIDDTQEYLFEISGVNIGMNTQGIEEIAPILTLFDGKATKSVEEYDLQKDFDKKKKEFGLFVVTHLANEGELPVMELDEHLRTISPSVVQRFYKDLVTEKGQEDVKKRWSKLVDEIEAEDVTVVYCTTGAVDTIDLRLENYSEAVGH